jgi:O-antigen/teichoic acid export membrane protein
MLVARHHLLGLRRVVTAQVAESVLRPALVLAAVGGVWMAGWSLDATATTGLYGAASAVGLGFLVWRITTSTPAEVVTAAPDPDPLWLRAALPLLVTGIARDLNAEAGMLVMGTFLPPDDAGLFRAATRLASLPTFVLTAMNLSFQPVAAALFATGDLAAIERLGVRASRVAVVLSLPIVAVFLLAGGPVLSVFGPGFSEAAPALAILAFGHLFNVACGSVGVILVACRREDDAARGLVFSCVVTLAANLVLVSTLGLIGAAIATTLGLVVWNVALSWLTWARLGIVPAAFSWRRSSW